jgi:hypothetical protein
MSTTSRNKVKVKCFNCGIVGDHNSFKKITDVVYWSEELSNSGTDFDTLPTHICNCGSTAYQVLR